MVEGECIHIEGLIPKTALFEPESSFTGIKNSKGMVEGECKHIEDLIPKTALSSRKAALRESNFKRYGRRRV